jgi:chemotaxis protein histidine kinase CheA
MPNEPLALPEFLTELPDAAAYDAVLAAIMATEGGRKFLIEFAERNRNTDTAMVVGAIARIEATLRGETAPPASTGPGDLIEIAAALECIAAAEAAGTARASDTAAAIERMQDIAFTLHERPLEAELRDSFDAALRELSATAASADPSVGDLLQALASRVREMIEARVPHRPVTELFAVPADNDKALAQAVAAFAEAYPPPAETSQPAPASEAANAPAEAEEKPEPVEPQSVAAEPVAAQSLETSPVERPPVEAAAPEPDPAAVAPPPIEATEQPPAETDAVAVEDAAQPPAPPDVFDSQAILSQAFSDDHFATGADEMPASEALPSEEVPAAEPPRDEPPRQELLSEELTSEQPPSMESVSEAALPAQEFSAEPVAGPEEDPADLFEPESAPQEAPAAEPPPAAGEAPGPPEPPQQVLPPPPTRTIPRPPLSDPLAAVRDLSEEELIALFS